MYIIINSPHACKRVKCDHATGPRGTWGNVLQGGAEVAQAGGPSQDQEPGGRQEDVGREDLQAVQASPSPSDTSR